MNMMEDGWMDGGHDRCSNHEESYVCLSSRLHHSRHEVPVAGTINDGQQPVSSPQLSVKAKSHRYIYIDIVSYPLKAGLNYSMLI